jgi:hypothetical protein
MLIGKLVEVRGHQIDLRAVLGRDPEDVTSDLIIWKPGLNYILPFERRVHDQEYIDRYNAMREPGTEPLAPRHIVHVPIDNGPAWVLFEEKLLRKEVL